MNAIGGFSAPIFNYRSLRVFKACVVKHWRKVLGKRSQKGCMNWANYRQLLIAFPGTGDPPGMAEMIDPPQVLSEEPTAVTPHGGFCGGESQQWPSYPTNLPVRFHERGVKTAPWSSQ